MLIQPSVQSASYTTTFASSVSATGVEQSAARAPVPPVEEASRDASSQNQTNRFQTTPSPALQPQTSAANAADTASQSASADDSSSSSATQDDTGNTARSAFEQQQDEADQVVIDQLKARDREVRIHEAAHAAVGGRYAGSASFEFRRGPDGKNYAVGGEVSISTGAVSGDPQATIEKAQTIRAAALAPAEPSAQDRRVAAQAAQLELDARGELQQQEVEARAEAEKAREQAATEQEAKKRKNSEQKDAVAAADEARSTQTSEREPVEPAFTPVVSTGNKPSDQTDQEKDSSTDQSSPRPNARQELEKILLGSTGILVHANQLGLVDPQNPYGKSGFLDVIA